MPLLGRGPSSSLGAWAQGFSTHPPLYPAPCPQEMRKEGAFHLGLAVEAEAGRVGGRKRQSAVGGGGTRWDQFIHSLSQLLTPPAVILGTQTAVALGEAWRLTSP